MKPVVEEQMSAFLDGELPAAEEELLLRRLERETGYQERLARYAMIGQLIRGEAPSRDGAELAARVGRAVAGEAAHQTGSGPAGTPRRWRVWVPAGIAAAAGLVVLSGLLSLSGLSVEGTGIATGPVQPQVRVADFQTPADAPIEPRRLTGYLVAHGEYAGGLSRQVVSSHVVNGTPEFLLANAVGGRIDE
jgi:negative regulator of sigma E activity